MIKPKTPCMQCKPPKRFIGCHGQCQDYIKFKEDDEKYKQTIVDAKRKECLGFGVDSLLSTLRIYK